MDIEKFLKIVEPYTMTSSARIAELFLCLEHIRLNNVEGDLIECGVWKGGNILGILEYLDYYKMLDRNVWLYDTFAGLTKPTEKDFGIINNMDYKSVLNEWEVNQKENNTNLWCYCDVETVKNTINVSKYPKEKIKFVVGDIIETLKVNTNIPNKISLLRLDTDWYESTKIEMEILYPNLVENGVLIVDDYGCWNGSKIAVDEYFKNKSITPVIKVIDDTGISLIKSK
jgi:hypothetical protein